MSSTYVPVQGDVQPTGDFASHSAKFGKGGLHGVLTLNEMYLIPLKRRELPMLCFVANAGGGVSALYKLITNPTTAVTTAGDWENVYLGGATGGTTYIGNYVIGDVAAPVLNDGEGVNGEFYIVIGAGNISFGGGESPRVQAFTDKDWIIYDGGTWRRIIQDGDFNYTTLPGKPLSFPPDPHTHTISEVTNLVTELLAKVDKTTVTSTITEETDGFKIPDVSAIRDYIGTEISDIEEINGKLDKVLIQNETVDTSEYDFSIKKGVLSLDWEMLPDVDFGSGFNGIVSEVIKQADGKIIAVGDFTTFNGGSANRIVRIDTDGSIDASFITGTGFNVAAQTVALQVDGKVLVGGSFTDYNGSSVNYLARLNANGSIDTGFNSGGAGISQSAGYSVRDIKVQSNEKIIVSGRFTAYNGDAAGGILRLNTDGTKESLVTFNPGTGVESIRTINCIEIQSDGKIVLSGAFTSFNGVSAYSIVRINSDGSIDSSFVYGTGFTVAPYTPGTIYDMALFPDGKIVVVGSFETYNDFAIVDIVVLNTDGSRDNTFNPGTSASSVIQAVAIQPDNKILIGGGFTTYNDVTVEGLARLNTNGSLDETLILQGLGFTGSVLFILYESGDTLLASGDFTAYDLVTENRIIKLNFDGSVYASKPQIYLDNGTIDYKAGYHISPKSLVPAEWVEQRLANIDIPEGYTTANFDADLATKTTDDLTEGDAKFVTQAQKDKIELTDSTVSSMVSTGVIFGGALTINAGDNTKLDIAAGKGFIANHTVSPSTYQVVTWTAKTAVTITNLATAFATDIAINASGDVVQQNSFTNTELRSLIFLGGVDHSGKTIINNTFSVQVPAFGIGTSLKDLTKAIGDINLKGNVFAANGTDLKIKRSAGETFSYGRNAHVSKNDPHTTVQALANAINFNYVYNDGVGNGVFLASTQNINPDSYDGGAGSLTAVPNNNWSVQRLLFFSNTGNTFVQYGTQVFTKKSDAIAGINAIAFPTLNGIASAVTRGYLIVKKGATNLASDDALFLETNRFGGLSSASASAEIVFGTTAGTAAEGNDPRLSDTRTPTDASVTDAKLATDVKIGSIASMKTAWGGVAVAFTNLQNFFQYLFDRVGYIGTKTVDETGIALGKILEYNGTNWIVGDKTVVTETATFQTVAWASTTTITVPAAITQHKVSIAIPSGTGVASGTIVMSGLTNGKFCNISIYNNDSVARTITLTGWKGEDLTTPISLPAGKMVDLSVKNDGVQTVWQFAKGTTI